MRVCNLFCGCGCASLKLKYTKLALLLLIVDVLNAGDGNLEIKVNDGMIPCSVANLGNRKYRATFTPREAKQHFIQMTFNSQNVIGRKFSLSCSY